MDLIGLRDGGCRREYVGIGLFFMAQGWIEISIFVDLRAHKKHINRKNKEESFHQRRTSFFVVLQTWLSSRLKLSSPPFVASRELHLKLLNPPSRGISMAFFYQANILPTRGR